MKKYQKVRRRFQNKAERLAQFNKSIVVNFTDWNAEIEGTGEVTDEMSIASRKYFDRNLENLRNPKYKLIYLTDLNPDVYNGHCKFVNQFGNSPNGETDRDFNKWWESLPR